MADKNRFWIKLLVGLGVLLLGFAAVWGVVGKTVSDNSKTLEKHEVKIQEHREIIIEQRHDIKHIKKAVDRIEKKL